MIDTFSTSSSEGHHKRSSYNETGMENESEMPLYKRIRGSSSTAILQDIPSTSFYQVSYAHRSVITSICYSPKYDMVLTASEDGIVKFWKRVGSSTAPSIPSNYSKTNASGKCLEFVKSYLSHTAPIQAMITSLPDGGICASIGEDNVIKVYDIGSFDVTGMIKLKGTGRTCGGCATFIGEDQNYLAVSASPQSAHEKGLIYVFSIASLSPTPAKIIQLHAAPVSVMAYNYNHHVVISSDYKGIIEYWNGSLRSEISTIVMTNITPLEDYEPLEMSSTHESVSDGSTDTIGSPPTSSRNGVKFRSKLNDTDLYTLVRKKTHAVSIAVSPSGLHFALYGSDRKVRLFEYTTGKLIVQYDERMQVYDALVQKSNTANIDTVDYGKRAAIEREMADTTILSRTELDNHVQECGNQHIHMLFDSAGSLLFLPTVLGIKVIDIETNKCSTIVGKGDASGLRFIGGCLCLGDAKVDRQMLLARSGGSSAAVASDETKKMVNDSLLISLAFKKRRFYIFSHIDPFATGDGESKDHHDIVSSRDILNEPPDIDDLKINQKEEEDNRLGNEAVLRTTLGDIHIRLFPNETPRTVENFCGHARSGYYDNVIFHRVIKVNRVFSSRIHFVYLLSLNKKIILLPYPKGFYDSNWRSFRRRYRRRIYLGRRI